jgi:hypothetical protein
MRDLRRFIETLRRALAFRGAGALSGLDRTGAAA